MSSAQPASAASAAAEASAGDPRFAQLLLGAYQWLETNGSSLLTGMEYLAQNTRPGGQQPTDKYIALLDVRVPNGASVQNISYEDLPKEPVLITYDPGAGPLLVKRLAKIYEDWDFPKEYAEMRAKETAVVMADVGGVVLAIGDEPSPQHFQTHAITIVIREFAILWVPSTGFRVGRRSQHAFKRLEVEPRIGCLRVAHR